MSVLQQIDSAALSLRQARARVNTSKRRVKPRKFVVSKFESAAAVTNPILVSCRPGMLFTFKGMINGAIVGRISGSTGEHIRIYNPTTQRWECYPTKDFESGFFKLSAAIGIGSYAILQDVFHTSSGTDYCTDWGKGSANVALRVITPTA